MAPDPEVAVLIEPLGHALLAAAALAGVGAAVLLPTGRRGGRELLLLHAAAFGAALLLLVLAFLLSRVEIAYVWEHTDAAYPVWYKLSGVWGGQKGTVLLWGALTAALAALDARRGADGTGRLAQALLALLGAAFAAYLVVDEAFAPTAASALASRPMGRGLQEVLVTPFMVIHPPVQFVAYALIALPAAYALAGLFRADPPAAWAARAMAWARPAWLAATLGLGLGGLWAYYVLSFGGFWAWDPVETANLLPWLALTAYVHAGKDLERHEDFRLAAPALAVASFALVIFATFATRSGLWISVHAFTDPTGRFAPDAASRLVAILEAHRPTRFFLGLLAATLLLSAAALARTVRAPAGRAYTALAGALAGWALVDPTSLTGLLFEAGARLPMGAGPGAGALLALFVSVPLLAPFLRETGGPRFPVVSERGLMHAAVVVLGVGLAVTLVLDLMAVNGADRAVFDARAPFVALPLLAVLTARFGMETLGAKRAWALGGGSLALAVAGALLFPSARVVAAAAPVLAAALLATFLSLVRANLAPGLSPRARASGALLLTSGFLGMVLWSNPPSLLNLLVGAVPTGLPHALLLFPAALAALLCGVLVLRGYGPLPARIGAALGVAAWGYGAGAVLAVAALVLAPAARTARAGRAPLVQALSRTGIRLLHVGLVVGLAGYAAATYAAEKVEVTESQLVGPGGIVHVGGHELVLGQPVTEGAGTWRTSVTLPVTVLREGREVDRASLRLEHKGAPIHHYDPVLDIRRGYEGDLYLVPNSMRVDGTWIRAHGEACTEGDGVCVRSANVEAVAFTVHRLPLLTLVWAGLWILCASMLLILAGRALRVYTTPTEG